MESRGRVGRDNSTIYTLGLEWDKIADMLSIAIMNGESLEEVNTKRMKHSTEQRTLRKCNPPSTLGWGGSLECLVDFLVDRNAGTCLGEQRRICCLVRL